MKKETSDQYFTCALNFLIKKCGRGTQAALAKKIGVNPGHLSNIVRGKVSPSNKIQPKIATFFGYHLWHMIWLGEWIAAGYPGELWDEAIIFVKKNDWSSFLTIDPFSVYGRNNRNVNFILALNYLLMRKGAAAKKRLSKHCKINESLLDKLLKGDFALLNLPDSDSQKIDKENISQFFNLDYRAIEKLGFWISELYFIDDDENNDFTMVPRTINLNNDSDKQPLSISEDNRKNKVRTDQDGINIKLLTLILSSIDKILDGKGVEITKEKKAKIAAMTYQELIKSNYDLSGDNLACNEVLQDYIDLAI